MTVRVIGQKQQEVVRSRTNWKLLWSRSRLGGSTLSSNATRQLGATQTSRVRDRAVASLGQKCLRFDTKGTSEVVTLNTEQLSSRLRERLSEPAMLDLTKRLIAIPSENPAGNHYEECARTLFDELDRLGFDDVRREGACVLASAGTGPRTLYFSGHYDVVPAQSQDQFQPRVEGV